MFYWETLICSCSLFLRSKGILRLHKFTVTDDEMLGVFVDLLFSAF